MITQTPSKMPQAALGAVIARPPAQTGLGEPMQRNAAILQVRQTPYFHPNPTAPMVIKPGATYFHEPSGMTFGNSTSKPMPTGSPTKTVKFIEDDSGKIVGAEVFE